MQQPQQMDARVSRVDWLTPDCYRLYVSADPFRLQVDAGQFFMLRRDTKDFPLLPRPFSVCSYEGTELSFLIKTIGAATRSLGASKPGETIRMTGPLGHPFPSPSKSRHTVILAGGIGIAPFPLWVQQALSQGAEAGDFSLIFGARQKEQLYDLAEFENLGVRSYLTTDDGSAGVKGNAVQCLVSAIDRGDIPRDSLIVACGPEPMLEAAWHLGRKENLDLHLSLETFMACGVGVCNGCTVLVEPDRFDGWPYAKACQQGPTFSCRLLKI